MRINSVTRTAKMSRITKLFLLQFLIVIFTLSRVKPQTIGTDCNGKDFLCVDADRYQVCVGSGTKGRSETVDAIAYPCALGSYCASDGVSACDSLIRPSTPTMVAATVADWSTLPITMEIQTVESETTNTILEAVPSTSQEPPFEGLPGMVSPNSEPSSFTESDASTTENTSNTLTLGPETSPVDITSNSGTTQSSTALEDVSSSGAPTDSSSTQSVDTSDVTLLPTFSTSAESDESSGEDVTSSVETTSTAAESTSNFDSSTSETASSSSTPVTTESTSSFESSTTQAYTTTSTTTTETETSTVTLESTAQPSTTETSTTEQLTTTKEPFVCQAQGRYPHETDCHKYYRCLLLPDGLLTAEMTCLGNMAYDQVTRRCVIDQSVCQGEQAFVCTAVGKFPDPSDPDRYFWCLENESEYHLYTMNCPSGQQFSVDVGQCRGSMEVDESSDSESSEESNESLSVSSESSEESG